MSEAAIDQPTEIPTEVPAETPVEPTSEAPAELPVEPQIEEPAPTLTEQDLLELDKRKKRCERFGEPFDFEEVGFLYLTKL